MRRIYCPRFTDEKTEAQSYDIVKATVLANVGNETETRVYLIKNNQANPAAVLQSSGQKEAPPLFSPSHHCKNLNVEDRDGGG